MPLILLVPVGRWQQRLPSWCLMGGWRRSSPPHQAQAAVAVVTLTGIRTAADESANQTGTASAPLVSVQATELRPRVALPWKRLHCSLTNWKTGGIQRTERWSTTGDKTCPAERSRRSPRLLSPEDGTTVRPRLPSSPGRLRPPPLGPPPEDLTCPDTEIRSSSAAFQPFCERRTKAARPARLQKNQPVIRRLWR